jgi:hypothetical protein
LREKANLLLEEADFSAAAAKCAASGRNDGAFGGRLVWREGLVWRQGKARSK